MGSRIVKVLGLVVMLVVLFTARVASALTVQAPAGGSTFPLPEGHVVCGIPPEGWTVDATHRRLHPPSEKHAGEVTMVLMAPKEAACSTEQAEKVTLIATGPFPSFDASSIVVSVDAGRLELHGTRLEGVRIGWKNAGGGLGSDTCLDVAKTKDNKESCALNVDKGLPADPLKINLRWAAPGGRTDPDVVTYDLAGNALSEDRVRLPIARVLIHHVFPASRTADVASGEGHIELVHPDAISSADCGVARCEVTESGVVVRAVPASSQTIPVRVRLLPRVFVEKADGVEQTAAETLTVLRCPLTVVSGDPLRNVDDLRVLVRLDKACAQGVEQLRWTVGGDVADVTRTATLSDGVYLLLWVGRVSSERFSIAATRMDDGSVVAVTSERTWEPPPLNTSLGLPSYGYIDFIPKNREALLSVAPISPNGRVVPIAIPGAYTVEDSKEGFRIRGVYTSGGFTSLKFAYRATSVPPEFAETNFATLLDPVQRPIREANVPAPIGASNIGREPIVELVCRTKSGKVESLEPGTSPHIPFNARDTCRLLIHRDRIPLESGEQRLGLDVAVNTVASAERGEAKISQRLVLRHGPDPVVIWIHGAKEQFDRISIRVSHALDESQYMSGSIERAELPVAQWTVVTEDANFKFYATAAIPASLYRFSNDPNNLGTGPLALNFGVLSRFTWLDREGHEGIVGLEFGVMGMGLETDLQRQLAIVGGLGVSVPLGNINQPTQAAVNIHAWVAYSVGDRTGTLTDTATNTTRTVGLNPWAFVFGPSITIGNIGAFL